MNTTYLLVDSKIVPEVYLKVVEAKRKISSGKFNSVNDVLKTVGISRSTFYKYKDNVFAGNEIEMDKLISLEFTLDDIPGILSAILKVLSEGNASVLTINQNIPINDVANVTITFKLYNLDGVLDDIMANLKKVKGVNKVRVIAMN